MAATPQQTKKTVSAKTSVPSSPGDSPVAMTATEASPEDATWKDRTPRNIHSDDPDEKTEALLDKASDLSFPASDPIAVSSVTRIEKKAKRSKRAKAGK